MPQITIHTTQVFSYNTHNAREKEKSVLELWRSQILDAFLSRALSFSNILRIPPSE